MVTLAYILALPLFGALLMLLIGRKLPHALVSVICCGTVGAAFVLAAAAWLNFSQPVEVVAGPWIPAVHADWGLRLDRLSGTFALVITGIGFLIHLYSVGYMKDDGGYARYFGSMNLFLFAMLLLVLANNFVLMFAGWEGVGLASYLLIGFWFHRPSAVKAATKAIIVNRIADVGLLVAILWSLYREPGTEESNWIGLLFLIGAIAKSAQFPLHVWLPDAMEGPTPVSALIHAATMVTAGVYLMNRVSGPAPLVAAIGAFTAIFAASIAIAQHDIKRVLAWSTISQLGYMFLALGVGARDVAIFHMITHAFFKALLFLAAGNVIHALSGEQDLNKMGGLRRSLPRTHILMVIGAASLAGVPGFAGFFSKDQILTSAWGHNVLITVGFITALLTAFYAFRLIYLVFYGSAREEHEHVHEPAFVMAAPAMILAIGSVIAGWPIVSGHAIGAGRELAIMGISAVIAGIGWVLARRFYLRAMPNILARAYYVDEIYDAVFVRGFVLRGGRILNAFDGRIVDGGVNGVGWVSRFISQISIWWDTWIVDGLVRVTAFLIRLGSYPVRFAESGFVQFYALVFLGGLIVFVGYFVAR